MVIQVWSLPLLPSYHHGIILKKIPDIIIFHLNMREYVQELALQKKEQKPLWMTSTEAAIYSEQLPKTEIFTFFLGVG